MGETLDWPTDQQLRHVWKLIDKLELGQVLVVADHAPNKPEVFTQCLKMWIDTGGNGEFSNDYKLFYKTK